MSTSSPSTNRLSSHGVSSLDVPETGSLANTKGNAHAASPPEDASLSFRNLLERLGEMHDTQVGALIAENKKLQLKLSQTVAAKPAAVEHLEAECVSTIVALPGGANSDQAAKRRPPKIITQGLQPKQSPAPAPSQKNEAECPGSPSHPWQTSGRWESDAEQQPRASTMSIIKKTLPFSENDTFESGPSHPNAYPGVDFMVGLNAFPSTFSNSMNAIPNRGKSFSSPSKATSLTPSMTTSLKPKTMEEALEPNLIGMAAMLAGQRRRQERESKAVGQAVDTITEKKVKKSALSTKASVLSSGSRRLGNSVTSWSSSCIDRKSEGSSIPEMQVEPWEEWVEERLIPHLRSWGTKTLERSAHHDRLSGFFSFSTTGRVLYNQMMLHPNSRRRLVWDLLSCCLIAYDVVAIPLVTGFELQEVNLFIVTDWITLIFWTIDILLSFTTGFYDNGLLEMRPWKVVKRYLLTWFCPDMFIVGTDWTSKIVYLMSQSASNIKVIRAFRIMRFGRAVRFLRLLKVSHVIQAIHDEISTESTSIFFEISLFTSSLLAMAHVIGCMWHGIGLIGDDGSANANSWLRQHNMADDPLGMRYFTCLHWALTFFMSNSEIEVHSFLERVYTVIVLVLALLVFSSFLSMMTSSCIQLWNMRNEKRRQFWFLRRYLRERSISKPLALRVEQYLKTVWESDRKCVHESQVLLLKRLSEALQGELRFESLLPYLECHALFRKHDTKAKEIVNSCFEMMAAANDVILTAGDQADYMLLMSTGLATYVAHCTMSEENDENMFTSARSSAMSSPSGMGDDAVVLRKYDWICEGPLWTPWVCLGTFEAKSICQLICIDSKIFREIVVKHYYLWEACGSYAVVFCQHTMQKLYDEKLVTDLPDEDLAYEHFRERHNQHRSLSRRKPKAKNWVQTGSMLSNLSVKTGVSAAPADRESFISVPSIAGVVPKAS